MVEVNSTVYFKALSDKTRIRLLGILHHHELNVNEIVALMEMGQSGISRHLKILIDAGLLRCRRDGIWAFYSVTDNGPGRRFMDAVSYLFDDEPLLKKDALKAGQAINDRKKETVRFFNAIATEWDLLRREIFGDFDLNALILSHLEPAPVAVDLGCGTGELLSALREQTEMLIGVDSSSQMLDEARKRFQGNMQGIDLRLGELEHLPLGDREADAAVISMALHHLSRPGAAIAEVWRILKPGGTLVIADLKKHEDEQMRRLYGDRWLGFTPREVEQWLTDSEFLLQSQEHVGLLKSLELTVTVSTKKGE